MENDFDTVALDGDFILFPDLEESIGRAEALLAKGAGTAEPEKLCYEYALAARIIVSAAQDYVPFSDEDESAGGAFIRAERVLQRLEASCRAQETDTGTNVGFIQEHRLSVSKMKEALPLTSEFDVV